ncbi:GyrI-like domain-containing protein (plasmid) [Embleya sp. NBC_00888]|uniref:AraC family transcriptional regulator n=1 Tax=Embleya sp. NBC_00888 TaxID=2975960 RepID=UPI002F91A876|nr:GyrI-like domain-containing protein [Embleya sp. NBC_00888]
MFTMEEIPTLRIAYMRRVGPYGPENGIRMEELKKWAAANGLLGAATVVLGIPQDDPATTPPHDCRYDTCLVVPSDTTCLPAEIDETRLTGGLYAVLVVAHTTEGMSRAWAGLFHALADEGLTLDTARPILERYRPPMLTDHLCEICVPVI